MVRVRRVGYEMTGSLQKFEKLWSSKSCEWFEFRGHSDSHRKKTTRRRRRLQSAGFDRSMATVWRAHTGPAWWRWPRPALPACTGASPTVDLAAGRGRGRAERPRSTRRLMTDNRAALAPTDVAPGSAQSVPACPLAVGSSCSCPLGCLPGAVECGSKSTFTARLSISG